MRRSTTTRLNSEDNLNNSFTLTNRKHYPTFSADDNKRTNLNWNNI